MASKKCTWKLLFSGCFKFENPFPLPEPKIHVSHQITSQRLCFSDLSDLSSPLSVSDLSSAVFNLHVFTLKELEAVTHDFSKNNFLGEGGFGAVYKGFITDKFKPGLKAQPVAVKTLDLDGSQGHKEWLTEVIILGQLKHPHLVNLIGYCCEDEHRLLVYEYAVRGNLENQLFGKYSAALPWLTRLKIALGAAKGLAFLHGEEKPVIYRDFKASNVLLDADYNAKLSDFGLAKDGPQGDESHITTRVMGTEGYAAPEYIMTGHLTTMSDVFSFGVVLLELLTGKRSVDKNRPSREQNLVKWARPMLKDHHKLDQLMDPRLEGQYSTEGARKAAALTYQCLSHHCRSRPSMSHVVETLETLLQLNDIPIGPFVYVVSGGKEEINEQEKVEEEEDEFFKNEMDDGKESEEKKWDLQKRQRKDGKLRLRIETFRSAVVHSDTTLCRTLGINLYNPKQENLNRYK